MKCPKCGGNVLLRANVFTEGGQDDVVTCPLCGFLVLKPAADPVMPKIRTGFYCSECRQETVHHGRGLCRECYNRLKAEGTLDQEYPKASHNYGECAECGEIKSIMARGLCGRCYNKFTKTGELDELYPLYGRRIDMASKKTTKECRACGREMEISGRGLCGRCYGRVTRAINSGLTEAEAEEKLMAFLDEACELPEQKAERACPSFGSVASLNMPGAKTNDEDFLDSVDAGKREPVAEERIAGWGVEPVENNKTLRDLPNTFEYLDLAGNVIVCERRTSADQDNPTKPRPMVRPPSRQEWLMMRCEDLARSIHRVLERRMEGVTEPQEITEAGEWLMELTTHFDGLAVAK